MYGREGTAKTFIAHGNDSGMIRQRSLEVVIPLKTVWSRRRREGLGYNNLQVSLVRSIAPPLAALLTLLTCVARHSMFLEVGLRSNGRTLDP